jgi:hypothetical protein
MTLKEKFNIISCNDCDMPYCDIKCTMLSEYELNKLEQIADDYAIEFAEWCVDKYRNNLTFKHYNNKQILEIFKTEKGL